MTARLLPNGALKALGRWWNENAVRYSDGTPGAHTVRYTPSRWVQITPWPSVLVLPSHAGDAEISRAEVTCIVADTLRREAFREALVATYVWGKANAAPPRQRTGHTAQDPGRQRPRCGPLLHSHRAIRLRRASSLRGASPADSRVRAVLLHQVPVLQPARRCSPRTVRNRSSSTASCPCACDRSQSPSAGRLATTPTVRSQPGYGRTGIGRPTATRSISLTCTRPPSSSRAPTAGRPVRPLICSNARCSTAWK